MPDVSLYGTRPPTPGMNPSVYGGPPPTAGGNMSSQAGGMPMDKSNKGMDMNKMMEMFMKIRSMQRQGGDLGGAGRSKPGNGQPGMSPSQTGDIAAIETF